MSDSKCEAGDTTGFPIKLSQSLHSTWPATKDVDAQLKKLTVPTDFSVQWGPPTPSAQISVRQTTTTNGIPGVFQISGISTITDSTTLTYGDARYSCSGVLSIVQNQHPTLCTELTAQYEVILAFQITNKEQNPSSPDIILLCRPIIFSSWNSSPFWPAVDQASVRKTPQNVALDMSTMFGFDSSTLMPMITYQSCLPVKILNYKSQPYSYGSLRFRVNVVQQPLYMVASENGLGKCSYIKKYTLITSGSGPVSIFSGASSNTILQFRDGYGPDLFPAQTKNENLVPNPSAESISAFDDITDTIQIQVPESFVGKSLAELAAATKVEPVKPKKKAFKCYTIDPDKDIKGDQIMIDPTTGERLKDILDKDVVNSDGSPIKSSTSYVLYGSGIVGEIPVQKIIPLDIEDTDSKKIVAFMSQDKDRLKILIAPEQDPAIYNMPIPKSPTGYVLFGGNIKGMLPVTKIIKLDGYDLYCSQDGNLIWAVAINKEYTEIRDSDVRIGDLSNVNNDYPDFKNLRRYTPGKRNIIGIKKTDGTGMILPTMQGLNSRADISKVNSLQDIQKLFIDRTANSKPESLGYRPSSSSQVDINSSGILPGDIEKGIILTLIIIGSVCLFSYLGYIVHMWFYHDNGFRNSAMHIVIFTVLLIALVIFATFTAPRTEDSDS